MTQNKTVTALTWFVTLAIVALAAGSFVLSFTALKELATDAGGISPRLAFIWPLIVDLSLCVYTAAILANQLNKWSVWFPVLLVMFYAGTTVVGNVAHAPATPLGWFIAALPPLSLILATECLRTLLKNGVERSAVLASIGELTARGQEAAAHLEALNTRYEQVKKDAEIWDNLAGFGNKDIGRKSPQWEKLRALIWERDKRRCANCRRSLKEGHFHCHHIIPAAIGGRGNPINLVTLCEDCHAKVHDNELFGLDFTGSLPMAWQAKQEKIATRRAEVYELVQAGETPANIAEALDVSVKTIRRDIKAVNGDNGRGAS